MTGPATRARTDAAAVRALTIVYDMNCGFCRWVRDWLTSQRTLVPIDVVAAQPPRARDARIHRDMTVVGDGGQVYEGARAWVVILWALARYRALALQLAAPARQRLAVDAVAEASRFQPVTKDEIEGALIHKFSRSADVGAS